MADLKGNYTEMSQDEMLGTEGGCHKRCRKHYNPCYGGGWYYGRGYNWGPTYYFNSSGPVLGASYDIGESGNQAG